MRTGCDQKVWRTKNAALTSFGMRSSCDAVWVLDSMPAEKDEWYGVSKAQENSIAFCSSKWFPLSFVTIAHYVNLTWRFWNALDGTWWMPVLFISVWWAERQIQLLWGLHLMKFSGDVMYLSLFSVLSVEETFLGGLTEWVMYVSFHCTRFSTLEKELKCT